MKPPMANRRLTRSPDSVEIGVATRIDHWMLSVVTPNGDVLFELTVLQAAEGRL